MSEDIIRHNFFGISYSRQIEILDLYLNDMICIDSYDTCMEIFEKYMIVLKKFSEFKDRFKKFDEDDRKKMRSLIDKCKSKIGNETEVIDYGFCFDKVNDIFVDKYVYDSFSYSKDRRVRIAFEFFNYYSKIINYDFNQVLGLFESNKDFFNQEIKKISVEFYSLYLSMSTVDRMKYIWYLSNFNVFTSEHANDGEFDIYDVFSSDSNFIKPLHMGSKESLGTSKKLSKYFNVK